MHDQKHHEMVLAATHDTGSEEWFCPTCGRRFLLRWPPAYEKIVLDPGDEYVAHSGSKSDMLSMGAVDVVGSTDPVDDDDLFAARRQAMLEAADEPPPVIRSAADEELGDVPLTDELQPWLKWLASADGSADEPDQAA